jgi:O-antigen ligase
LLLLVLPLLFYSVEGGYGVAYGLLVCFAVLRIAYIRFLAQPTPSGDLTAWTEVFKTPFVAAIAIYCGVCIAIDLAHNEPINAYERYLVWVLAPIVLIGLRGLPLNAEAFFIGGALAAIVACTRALYMVTVEGVYRPAPGANNPILFGNTSLLLAMLCLSGFLYSAKEMATAYRTLLLIGTLAGLYASFLSGSRGGWISLPLLVIILGIHSLRFRRWRQFIALVLITAIGAGLSFAPGSPVPERLREAREDLEQYARTWGKPHQDRVVGGGVGNRLEQYLVSGYAVPNHVLIGRSHSEIMKLKTELVLQGKIHSSAADPHFISVHNELIDHLLQRGVVGLLALIIFYALIIREFSRSPNPPSSLVGPKLFGTVMGFALIEFGLTNPQLIFSHTRHAFGFLIVVAVAVTSAMQKNRNT